MHHVRASIFYDGRLAAEFSGPTIGDMRATFFDMALVATRGACTFVVYEENGKRARRLTAGWAEYRRTERAYHGIDDASKRPTFCFDMEGRARLRVDCRSEAHAWTRASDTPPRLRRTLAF